MSKLDDIQEELGFCNCGCPEDNLQYIRDGLRLIKRKWDWDTDILDGWGPADKADEIALHGTKAAAWFFAYWVDSKGWAEHGDSVFTQRLSDEGKQFLARLEEAIKEEET